MAKRIEICEVEIWPSSDKNSFS